MLCPKCQTATAVRRKAGNDAFICRDKRCAFYGKVVKERKSEVSGDALNDTQERAKIQPTQE